MDLIYTRTAITYPGVHEQEMTGAAIRAVLQRVCVPAGATQRSLLADRDTVRPP